MSKIIIFDFEVFKYDTLLGAIIIDDKISIMQTWDLEEIKQFYLNNITEIWIGHNNSFYDNKILQAIIKKQNPQFISKQIIDKKEKIYFNIPLFYYDLMSRDFVSLKAIECVLGKNISESPVDFDLDRYLTDEEKKLTEQYNLDDLEQTYENFLLLSNEFELRVNTIEQFNLDLDALNLTGAQVAELILGAKKIYGIENDYVKPILYDNLQIENEDVINFYLTEKFRQQSKLAINICGLEHTIGAGGIHGAKRKCHYKEAVYLDVSGYYNNIMIKYNLLSRTIGKPELYEFMYEEQKKLKKIDPDSNVRKIYKETLLSVFGASLNKFSKFYDEQTGTLVTIVGQLFIIDLLEKLEGKIELIQSNTDGIILVVLDDEVFEIIDEWKNRTGFELDFEPIHDLYQRDVNNYMYRNDKGKIITKGEIVKYYDCWQNPFEKNSYRAGEPFIIYEAIVNYFMKGIDPEETIKINKNNLLMFQYVASKEGFDWIEYEENNIATLTTTTTKVQNVNRAFAYNHDTKSGMLYKHRHNGKTKKSKIPRLPNSVFIYNDEILSDEAKLEIMPKIDYNYYVERSCQRIKEFQE